MSSNYLIQKASKSHCPQCHKMVDLLCTDDERDMLRALKHNHWFYICWNCKKIYEVGKGEVYRENESNNA